MTWRAARLKRAALLVTATLTACTGPPDKADDVLYRSSTFTVTDSTVHQGEFEAVAVSRDRIESNYQRAAKEVNFKFSINGAENEHPPGTDHMIYLHPRDGRIITPVYTFGELLPPTTPQPRLAAAVAEEGPVDVTFRLDMRHVLEAWRTAGVYDPPNGPPIAAQAFEGVYVIGNVEPLSWDFAALRPGARTQLHDPDGDGIYTVTLPFDTEFARPQTADGRVVWQRRRDLSRFPAYHSPQVLVDALHRLALEELLELRTDAGTFDAGGRWPGVWTRDLAWSTLLALALVAPDEVRAGLEARVDEHGRIVQDSGTGGSWPISTDRVSWALAAWELYAATGDREWLRTAYDVIRRSAEADLRVAFDPATGLFRGESTFLDWREQSYPDWMDPKDIGTSQALGTNALHFGTYEVLAHMARLLDEPSSRWQRIADTVRDGLDEHLWQPDRGHHGAYRYGRWFPVTAPHAEMLGEALTVILGATDEQQTRRIVAQGPMVPFGVPSFWPYIPGIPPYHNAGVWPQVVGFWAWAAAEAGNAPAVEHALASLYRAGGLFLTNKENWVAATGHFEGTEVNSDRFQASAAAQLATVYRVLFGIRLHEDHMELHPFVPEPYAGTRTLENLHYRDATLTIILHGFGDTPREIRLDDHKIPRPRIPAALTGPHTLEITLNNAFKSTAQDPSATLRGKAASRGVSGGALDKGRHGNPRTRTSSPARSRAQRAPPLAIEESARVPEETPRDAASGRGRGPVDEERRIRPQRSIRSVDNLYAPATPQAHSADQQIRWEPVTGAARYVVYRNGLRLTTTRRTHARAVETAGVAEYQVQAVDDRGLVSFLSEPLRVGSAAAKQRVEPSPDLLESEESGYEGNGYARLTAERLTALGLRVSIETAGLYAIDLRYANGSGAVSYGNKTAVRTLLVDGETAGKLLLPQRGIDRWDDWGYSNAVLVQLEPGPHTLTVAYRPADRNMDGTVSEALLDHLRLTRVAR